MIIGLISEALLWINGYFNENDEIRVLKKGKRRFHKAYAKPWSFGDRMKVHSFILVPFHIIDFQLGFF